MTWWVLWSVAASGSPWLEPAGSVTAGLQWQRMVSRQQFAPGGVSGLSGPLCPDPVDSGERGPYSCVNGGTFSVHSLTAQVRAGVHRHLSIDVSAPAILAAAFEDDLGKTVARGIGDVQVGVRAGTVPGPVVAAATLEIELPTGPTGFQERDVALGDGQVDVSPGVRGGVSLWPWGWAETHHALRWRFRNPATGIDPGEEWVGAVTLGLQPHTERVGVIASTDWILATRDVDAFGLRPPGRQIWSLRSSIFARPVEALWLQVGVALPIAGRRYPAGSTPFAAVTWRWASRAEPA